MRRISLVVPLLVMLVLGLVSASLAPAARAQDDATPAGETTFPITPDAADCQVEPRSTDELLAIWLEDGTPAAATPADAGPTEVTIPLGTPADEETVAAVTDTVRQVFACFAAGNFPAALALFTEDLIRQFGPPPGTTEEQIREFVEATPEAGAAGEAGQILAITDVMDLEDGRVGAFVVDTAEGTPSTVYAIFERDGDQLLADEIIEFSASGEDGGEEE
jgi:hypothetical protein